MKRENEGIGFNQNDGSQGNTGPSAKRVRNEGDQDIRLLIPSKFAGAVIGKGGENIKKLRSEYQAHVSVGDCQGPERVVTIGASLEQCCNVIRDLIKHFDKGNVEEYEIRILIHQSLAGCVIGKGGAKIKELKDKLGCRLKVFSNIAPQSTDRIVQIVGKEQQCIDAVTDIVNLIKDTPIKGNVRNYDPHNYDLEYSDEYGGYGGGSDGGFGGGRNNGGGNQGFGGGRGGGFNDRGGGRGGGDMRSGRGDFNDPWASGPIGRNNAFGGGMGNQGFGNNGGGFGGGNSFGGGPGRNSGGGFGGNQGGGGGLDNDNKSSTQVTIPKDRAGAIIGKGGNRIRRIRMQSNAMIQIDEALPGSDDRIITITGTPQQIKAAQYMLQQSARENMD